MSKQALGKGLSALLADEASFTDKKNASAQKTVTLSIDQLCPGKYQPRQKFDQNALKELSTSIAKNGVIQPVIVRPTENSEQYEIIAGERRWRASKLAGLNDIPAIIKTLDDKQALEFALLENIQREDLSPLEEAEGYQRLIKEFSYTQQQLAEQIGKSRSHISNMLRILGLPEGVKDLIKAHVLTMGHARTLVNSDDPAALAKHIIDSKLSVRDAEKFALGSGKQNNKPKASIPLKDKSSKHIDSDLLHIETKLSQRIGLPVTIEDCDNDGGEVVIRFTNLMELERVIQKLES